MSVEFHPLTVSEVRPETDDSVSIVARRSRPTLRRRVQSTFPASTWSIRAVTSTVSRRPPLVLDLQRAR